jgi:hypothetical protein
VTEPSVRLLVLPADPEHAFLEFDRELWAWWRQDHKDPANGQWARWGDDYQPTAAAAVRFQPSGDPQKWRHYLALHRHGGLEFELGDLGAREVRSQGREKPVRTFALLRFVGRLWAAFDLYRDIVKRCSVEGPWEISLALCKTDKTQLHHFGAGWQDRDVMQDVIPICYEKNLLFRQEIAAWPEDAEGVRELAFGLGSWVENGWGVGERRFLAAQGDLIGQFDWRNYQSI